jgi:hypothetical protein
MQRISGVQSHCVPRFPQRPKIPSRAGLHFPPTPASYPLVVASRRPRPLNGTPRARSSAG